MIWVSELTVKVAAAVEPNITAVALVKLVPVMVTTVSPVVDPVGGVMLVTVGVPMLNFAKWYPRRSRLSWFGKRRWWREIGGAGAAG